MVKNTNNKNSNYKSSKNTNNINNEYNISIAIGIGENKDIELAINEFEDNTNIKYDNVVIKRIKSNKEFLEEVKNKSSDAYIRGSLSASSTIKYLKDIYSDRTNNTIVRASLIKNNINNINNGNKNTGNNINKNNNFLLAPVGIDEGNTVSSKLEIVIKACEFLRNNGKIPKIAILSGGREDDNGRGKAIDEMLNNSEELYNKIKDYLDSNDYNKENKENSKGTVKNYYILIEEAINDNCNLIIAPNGIIGNIIFRSLVLVSNWDSSGAITLGIDEIFIDTSRSQSKQGYLRAIKLAYELTKKRIS